MLILIYFLAGWSLIFGMNAEKTINYIVNCVKRAQLGCLRGQITLHFNEGKLTKIQTISNENPPVDEKEKT